MARPNRKPQTHETASQTSVAAAVCPLLRVALSKRMSQIVCPAYVSSQHSIGVLAGHHAKVIQIELRRDIIGTVSTVPLLRAEGEGLTITAPLNALFVN